MGAMCLRFGGVFVFVGVRVLWVVGLCGCVGVGFCVDLRVCGMVSLPAFSSRFGRGGVGAGGWGSLTP